MAASNLQTFKYANLNLTSPDNIVTGDVVVFKDHNGQDDKEKLGIVVLWNRDKIGDYNGKSVSAVIMPLTPISRREFEQADSFSKKQKLGNRYGIRHILKPNSQELRNLSVNPTHYYALGYNIQLPGHKDIPDQDRLRVLSVTSETLLLGEGKSIQKLGQCDSVFLQEILNSFESSYTYNDARDATHMKSLKANKANSLVHAIVEKSELTRMIQFNKPSKQELKARHTAAVAEGRKFKPE